MKLLLIRHGPTDWNDAGRIQGHSDVALSARAVDILGRRRVPAAYLGWQWFASPLGRAKHTAALLGVTDPSLEPRLREMAWGDWEGLSRAEIETRDGAAMVAALTSRGLDFRPPGGESPRELKVRLAEWLQDIAPTARDSGAVAHKGVIRALLALATGWDMSGKAPAKLDWSRAHLFALQPPGSRRPLELEQANLPLERTDGGDPLEPVEGW